MVVIKPFKGIRPVKEKAEQVASPPYDVIERDEAKEVAKDNENSFLRIVKPEIDFSDDVGEYDTQVIEKGKENIQRMIDQGIFVQDDERLMYVYAQTMKGNTQYGLVACASVEDYVNNRIKKHELTRPDKEEGRKNHVRVSNMNYEPVFFAYPPVNEIDQIVEEVVSNNDPEYDFTDENDFRHTFWVINDLQKVDKIEQLFKEKVDSTYVADGHHRTAAAALVGEERKKNNPNHTGNEEYNFFLAVHFPSNQLNIIDYNRVVKDLNNLSKKEFLNKLSDYFDIEENGSQQYKPTAIHTFGMYLDGQWYKLTAKKGTYTDDPIGQLDVTILSKCVLEPILGIEDLRKSKRIDFVGGIRGLDPLEEKVNSGQMAVSFALYPVTMEQIINIADTGNIMPPKTTWFEPKLKSGLVIHSLNDE